MTAAEVITALKLEPLDWEGGWFRRTWESSEKLDERRCGSAIYFLITRQNFSALHRVTTTEIFHFYAGAPAELLMLHPDGHGEWRRLGVDLANGETPQIVIPGNTWQGLRVADDAPSQPDWTLLGATLAPEFVWDAFTLGDRETLIRDYPRWADAIHTLTR